MSNFFKPFLRNKQVLLALAAILSLSLLVFFSEIDVAAQPDQPEPNQAIQINANRNLAIAEENSVDEQPIKASVRLTVPQLNQMDAPSLYNGCEVTSLAMILNYHGFAVTKNQLADQLSTVPVQDQNGTYGNPNEAFVGDMTANNGPGYFVYHEPIYQLANQFIDENYQALDLTGSAFTELQVQLSLGNPVWVITTTTFTETGDNTTWQTAAGEVSISMSEHSVVLTGYDQDNVYLNDPYGNQDYGTDLQDFIASWEQMGQQAVVVSKVAEV